MVVGKRDIKIGDCFNSQWWWWWFDTTRH